MGILKNMMKENEIIIGTINLPININEETVGKIVFGGQVGTCTVSIYRNEGTIPHFHLYCKGTGFDSCICIYENKYFPHGGSHTDRLNSAGCKILDNWLNIKSKSRPDLTNWEHIRNEWVKTNDNTYGGTSTKPNYRQMQNFIDVNIPDI